MRMKTQNCIDVHHIGTMTHKARMNTYFKYLHKEHKIIINAIFYVPLVIYV